MPYDVWLIPEVMKDPEKHYRWVNEKDFHVQQRLHEGWKTTQIDLKTLPPNTLPEGQVTVTPSGGSVLKRGQNILMEMPRAHWEASVRAPKREANTRVSQSFDRIVDEQDEQAQRALHNAGHRQGTKKRLVYQEAPGKE